MLFVSQSGLSKGQYFDVVHSLTLPERSKIPVGVAPFGWVPTSQVPSFSPMRFQHRSSTFGASAPHGYRRLSSPRAARSHSASVGRRLPAKAQNAFAAAKSTQ